VGFQKKTLELFEHVKSVLAEYSEPITVRQCFYRLVAAHIIENTQNEYGKFGGHLVNAREAGLIAPEAFEDRTRSASRGSCYMDLAAYIDVIGSAYHRDRAGSQQCHVEVWCEKQALEAIFERVTDRYDIFYLSCRGYSSLTVLYEAAKRFRSTGKETHVLYFGDFDPSGEDMLRDIRDRLDFWALGAPITVHKIALTQAQIEEYRLPPIPAKESDTRTAGFVAEHGELSAVELDAVPPNVLPDIIEDAIRSFLDMAEFQRQRDIEEGEERDWQVAMKQLRGDD